MERQPLTKHILSLTLTLAVLLSSAAHAKKPNYCAEYGLGWNFYCQEEKAEEVKEDPKQIAKEVPQNQEDAAQKLAEIKKPLMTKKPKQSSTQLRIISKIIWPTKRPCLIAPAHLLINGAASFGKLQILITLCKDLSQK